jgi:hypothetical protein
LISLVITKTVSYTFNKENTLFVSHVAQVVECLLSKHDSPSSIPNTAKKKKRTKQKEKKEDILRRIP